MNEDGEYQKSYGDYFLNQVLMEFKIREGLGIDLDILHEYYTDIEVIKLSLIAEQVIKYRNKKAKGSTGNENAAAQRYSSKS